LLKRETEGQKGTAGRGQFRTNKFGRVVSISAADDDVDVAELRLAAGIATPATKR
jgi:hypothetical protein